MKESQESADLVTFTEETLNGKLHFLCICYCIYFREASADLK